MATQGKAGEVARQSDSKANASFAIADTGHSPRVHTVDNDRATD